MRALVDRELCISCGLCAEICPEVFVMDEEMIAQVIAEPVPPEAEEQAREAATACPVEAIKQED